MKDELNKALQEYHAILSSIEYNIESMDYSVLDKHISFIESINIQNSPITIFDLYQKKHVYISADFSGLLGWDIDEAHKQGNDYMDSRLHPEDALVLTKAGTYFIKMGLELAKTEPEAVKNYKFIADYRTKNKSGNYIRVIEQHKVLENDSNGNPWLSLSVMDLSPDTDIVSQSNCRLLNTITGEIFEFPKDYPDYMANPKLSGREKEILGLIAIGHASKEIADKLFISVNTVNTHRQRIIEKLDVSNTTEAVSYASRLGIIG